MKRYPLVRRLARPVLAVAGCVAMAAADGLAWHGSRLWLAIPLGMVGFAVAMAAPLLMWVGDTDPDDVYDRWGWLAALGPVLLFMSALQLSPAWYDSLTARPVAAVVSADLPDGFDRPGTQLVRLKEAGSGRELGEVWFYADKDLVVGDAVVAHVDRLGWARPSDGRGEDYWTAMGGLLGAAGLAGLGALLTVQVIEDRRAFRRRADRAG